LPELEYLPFYEFFSSWKTVGDDIHKKDAEIFKQFWDRMKAEVAAGTAPHSWGKEFVQSDYEKHGIDELGAIYTAYHPRVLRSLTIGGQCALLLGQSNGRIEAGSETTAQVLNNTIVGLLSNPEAVKKCHEELDRVIGDDRTPTFADEPNLPYIRALVKVRISLSIGTNTRKHCDGDQSISWDKTTLSQRMTGMKGCLFPKTRSS
jgi:hypothetical protein